MENNGKIARKTMPEIIAEYKAVSQRQSQFKTEQHQWDDLLAKITPEEFTRLFVSTSFENSVIIDPEEFILYNDNTQSSRDLEESYQNSLKLFNLEFLARNLYRFKASTISQGLAGSLEIGFKDSLKAKIEHVSITRE